jgi:hypothetical protein
MRYLLIIIILCTCDSGDGPNSLPPIFTDPLPCDPIVKEVADEYLCNCWHGRVHSILDYYANSSYCAEVEALKDEADFHDETCEEYLDRYPGSNCYCYCQIKGSA